MGGYNFGDGGGWSILDMGGDRYSWGGFARKFLDIFEGRILLK